MSVTSTDKRRYRIPSIARHNLTHNGMHRGYVNHNNNPIWSPAENANNTNDLNVNLLLHQSFVAKETNHNDTVYDYKCSVDIYNVRDINRSQVGCSKTDCPPTRQIRQKDY